MLFQDIQELPWCEDLDFLKPAERSELSISGNEILGASARCSRQDMVIVGIRSHSTDFHSHLNDGRLFTEERDQAFRLRSREALLKVRAAEHAVLAFEEDRFGQYELKLAQQPAPHELAWHALRSQQAKQSGSDHVPVEERAKH